MKKKERRMVKAFARSDNWNILSAEGKQKFCEMVLASSRYTKRDKKEIIKILAETK